MTTLQISSLTSLPISDGLTTGIQLWEGGTLIDTGIIGYVEDINDNGWAVGQRTDSHFNSIGAFLWQNGTVIDLTQLYDATAINDAGQIAGAVVIGGSGPTLREEAVLYQNGQITLLGLLNPASSAALVESTPSAINSAGAIVGMSSGLPFLWQNGVMSQLPLLTAGGLDLVATINDSGLIVGRELTDAGYYSTAIVWRNGKVSALPELTGDTYSYAGGVNDSGLIVGTCVTNGSDPGGARATLWDNGQAIDLNSLLPANSGWILTSAGSISNSGEITGTGLFDFVSATFQLTLGSGTATISVAAQTAVSAFDAIPSSVSAPILVLDSAADVGTQLDGLQQLAAAGQLSGIDFTNAGAPTLDITTAQLATDAGAIAKFSGNYVVETPGAGIINLISDIADYTVTASANGGVTVRNSDIVINVDRDSVLLTFADHSELVVQTPGVDTVTSGNLAELYGAVFGRQPDIAGLSFYQDYLTANPGTPLLQFAEWFLASPEYISNSAHTYAQTAAGDAQFISDSYQTLLHRTASAAEVAYYQTNVITPALAGLTAGTAAYSAAETQAHAQVLVYLSASPEFLSDVQVTAAHPADTSHWLILV